MPSNHLPTKDEIVEFHRSKPFPPSPNNTMLTKLDVGEQALGGFTACRSHPFTGEPHDHELYKISLPADVRWSRSVGFDRPAPVLIDGDCLRQVGAMWVDGSEGTIQFSRSAKGQEARHAYVTGSLSSHLAYVSDKGQRRPAAVSLTTASVSKSEKSDEMNNDASRIISLGEKYGQDDLAKTAVKDERSFDQFRKDLLDKIETKPLEMPAYIDGSQRSFDVGAFLFGAVTDNWSNAGFEREMSQEAARSYPTATRGHVLPFEVAYPELAQRSTLVSTGDISGGIGTVLHADKLIDALRPVSSVMAAGATSFSGLIGNADIPKISTDVSAAFTAEDAAISDSALDIDVVSLTPKLMAGTAVFSVQVDQQTTPNAGELIRRNLQLQIMNGIDSAALNGNGSGANPTGIASTTGIETFTTAGNATITNAESYDIIAEVAANNLDTSNGVWLVHPTDAATLADTSKDSGSGTFVYENGRIAGRRVIETTHVAAGSAYFGLFENCYIGFFGGLNLVVDPYSGAANGRVRVTAHQLCDVGVAHAGAFSKVTITS